MEVAKKQNHFVLVHGACHGAWCWYKLKPLLESAGHRVTALDLAASGNNRKTIQELRTFYDYSEPLMEFMASLPLGEKVILVGHSLGGMNLGLAMDRYPEKILVAVFLTAFLPDTVHKPSFVEDEFVKRTSPESWLDTQFESYITSDVPMTTMHFGPKFLASMLYSLSSSEDLELGTTSIRPGSLFREDLAKLSKFSDEGYGSVTRVYVVCKEDKILIEEFQRWMIKNCGVTEVKEINGADHMPMFSKPQEVCYCLLEILHK